MLRGPVSFLVLLLMLAPAAQADHVPIERDPAALLGLFPTHDDLQDLMKKAEAHSWATLHEIGASEKGRPLVLLEIADPNGTVPVEQRVVTLLLTQQHGNEPAGTGAAHELLEAFLAGEILQGGELDNQVLLLLPMANPDGAHEHVRRNAHDVDINRDHVGLESSEARAIHAILNRWDVHVAMDHHEYGGTGFGNPIPLRTYDYDLTTLFPRHGNVRAPTQEASEELMYDALWPAAKEAGYTVNEYGEMTIAGVPIEELAGGPDPGILRNNFGLNNVAGLLIETRVDAHPNPFHDAQRRIDIQRLVMEATLGYVSENAQRFVDAKRASENAALLDPASWYVEGDIKDKMPAALKVKQDLDALFALHGLPNATREGDHFVYSLDDPRQGLVAALLHPASSRAVAAGEPTDALPEPVAPASAAQAQVPLPALLVVAALAAGAMLRRR